MADNRLRCRGRRCLCGGRAGAGAGRAARGSPRAHARCSRLRSKSISGDGPQAVARDLRGRPGTTLVIAGDVNRRRVHAVAVAMNDLLGSLGAGGSPVARRRLRSRPRSFPNRSAETIRILSRWSRRCRQAASIRCWSLGETRSTRHPPISISRARSRRVPDSIYAGLYENETAQPAAGSCRLRTSSSLGGRRAYDGTLSLVQPLLRPLHGGRSPSSCWPPSRAIANRTGASGAGRVHEGAVRRLGVVALARLRRGIGGAPGGARASTWLRSRQAVAGLHPEGGAKTASLEIGLPRSRRRFTTAASRTTRGCRSCRADRQAHLGQRRAA